MIAAAVSIPVVDKLQLDDLIPQTLCTSLLPLLLFFLFSSSPLLLFFSAHSTSSALDPSAWLLILLSMVSALAGETHTSSWPQTTRQRQSNCILKMILIAVSSLLMNWQRLSKRLTKSCCRTSPLLTHTYISQSPTAMASQHHLRHVPR
jgi:hypothetical protein